MQQAFARVKDAHHRVLHAAHLLRVCPEADVPAAYCSLIEATEHGFALEHQIMEYFEFPATRCHLEQHARVLRALHCVYPTVMGGSAETARHVGGHLLMDWFKLHNETLDAALLLWVASCTDGELHGHYAAHTNASLGFGADASSQRPHTPP